MKKKRVKYEVYTSAYNNHGIRAQIYILSHQDTILNEKLDKIEAKQICPVFI